MGKKGPLWWRESDWLLRGSSAANQILLRHSGPILSDVRELSFPVMYKVGNVDILNYFVWKQMGNSQELD